MTVKGFIFDLDGTLVDSQLDFAAIRRDTGFPEGIGLLEHLDTLESSTAREDALAIIRQHELNGASKARWMPGALELMQTLSSNGFPIGIVTRNSREVLELVAGRLGIPPFDGISREDAAPKPQPQGLLLLAQRWNITPSELVYVGDYLFDLQAANAAGMISCYYDPQESRTYSSEADIVISHFQQMRESFL